GLRYVKAKAAPRHPHEFVNMIFRHARRHKRSGKPVTRFDRRETVLGPRKRKGRCDGWKGSECALTESVEQCLGHAPYHCGARNPACDCCGPCATNLKE